MSCFASKACAAARLQDNHEHPAAWISLNVTDSLDFRLGRNSRESGQDFEEGTPKLAVAWRLMFKKLGPPAFEGQIKGYPAKSTTKRKPGLDNFRQHKCSFDVFRGIGACVRTAEGVLRQLPHCLRFRALGRPVAAAQR